MQDFFRTVADHLPQQLMVLIDEYDHTANVLLETGPDEFSVYAEREQILRRFYAAIEKAATEGIVARSFIIGVTRLLKYPVAVGFPSAQDITDHEAFADLCGFTSAELQNVVQTTMTDKTLPVTDDELVNRMKDAYSGYRFSPSSDTLVVNPEACIHYLCYWYRRNCEATPSSHKAFAPKRTSWTPCSILATRRVLPGLSRPWFKEYRLRPPLQRPPSEVKNEANSQTMNCWIYSAAWDS